MSISKTARGSVVLSEIQNTEKNPTPPKRNPSNFA